jgi:hypothetical protein
MPVHQSILYIVPNIATKEQIAIGYLLTDNQTTMLCLSDKKINLTLPFFDTITQFLLKNKIESIKSCFSIPENKTEDYFLNADSINYWSAYDSNLLTFSKTTEIDVVFNESNFKKLFATFIAKNEDILILKTTKQGNVIKKILA